MQSRRAGRCSVTFLTSIPMGDAIFRDSKWYNSDWVHKQVMKLFGDLPDKAPREARDILYRVEPSANVRTEFVRGRVLVQYTGPLTNSTYEHVDLAAVLQALTVGTTIKFKTKINVVKTVNITSKTGTSKTSRRRVPDAELAQWFSGKMQGFVVDEASLDVSPVTIETMKKTPLYTATFSGIAKIGDQAAASSAVIKGIGKGRAYGCGLVSVIPVG